MSELNVIDPARRARHVLFGSALLLICVGIVMIYSASAVYADQRYADSMFFLKRHMLFIVAGLLGSFAIMSVPYQRFRDWTVPFLIICGLSLIFVFFVSNPIGGARRWIQIGPFNIQPSEFTKMAVILFLARTLADKDDGLMSFKKDILPPILIVGLFSGLILLGKDFGTTVVIGAVFFVMMFVSGLPLRYIALLIGLAVPLLVVAIITEPYRMARIVAFMNPWSDIRDTGFQLYQSLLAIGSGGMFGVGLGQSQQKLFYLPAAHTDFIFSIIGEEMGFIGAGVIIALFAVFALAGFAIMSRCHDKFGKLLALGLVSLIVVESMINIGVSIGALPTKGLALPFISYGGSALVAKMMVVGVLLNIGRYSESGAGVETIK